MLAAVKQIMPSKAADNCDLLAAILSVCGDVHVGLAHCVDAAGNLQSHCDELVHWPPQTADVTRLIADESVVSGAYFVSPYHNSSYTCELAPLLQLFVTSSL